MRPVPPRLRLLTAAVVGTATLLGSAPAASASGSRDDGAVIGGPQLATGGTVVNLAPGQQAPPRGSAASYVLADLGSGAVLAAKDPHGHFAPASTLKILTAVTFIPRLSPETKIT